MVKSSNMLKYFLFAASFLMASCHGSSQNLISTDAYFDLARLEFKGDLAFETVAFVEKYWRVAGNTGFNETVYRIAAKLEKAGYVLEEKASKTDRLTYRIEKRAMEDPAWEPVDASVTIIGQDHPLLQQSSNRNMVYLNSYSTPETGVKAEVIHIQNLEDLNKENVQGKIVFTEGFVIDPQGDAFAKSGALGVVTYNNPAYLQPEKNSTSIQFRSLSPQTNSKYWGIALSYEAKGRLKAALSKGKVELNVKIKTKSYPSEELTIVADVKGSELPDDRLVFSAHIQEPGANDNATGVGVQLEMAVITADLLKKNKINLARTLTFLWGDEIISTHRYIQEDKQRAEHIKWGISLDMVGENTSITGGSFLIEKMPDPSAIWTRGKDHHTEWGGEVLTLGQMKPHYLNDFILHNFKKQGNYANWEVNSNPFEGGSDHMPFLDANIPGLLLWHFTDQFYHTDNDRIDKVSKETLINVGTGALVSAFALVNADTQRAMEVLNTISVSATERMEDEFILSKQNVEKRNDIDEEIKILTAWKDWYSKAMESTVDMEKSPSQKLALRIKKAQDILRASTEKQIDSLNKL